MSLPFALEEGGDFFSVSGRDAKIIGPAYELVVLQLICRFITAHAKPIGGSATGQKLTCPIAKTLPDQSQTGHRDKDAFGLQGLGNPERGKAFTGAAWHDH